LKEESTACRKVVSPIDSKKAARRRFSQRFLEIVLVIDYSNNKPEQKTQVRGEFNGNKLMNELVVKFYAFGKFGGVVTSAITNQQILCVWVMFMHMNLGKIYAFGLFTDASN